MDGRFLDLLIRNCVICTFFDSHLYNIFPVCAVRSILLKNTSLLFLASFVTISRLSGLSSLYQDGF